MSNTTRYDDPEVRAIAEQFRGIAARTMRGQGLRSAARLVSYYLSGDEAETFRAALRAAIRSDDAAPRAVGGRS